MAEVAFRHGSAVAPLILELAGLLIFEKCLRKHVALICLRGAAGRMKFWSRGGKAKMGQDFFDHLWVPRHVKLYSFTCGRLQWRR